MRQSFVGGVGWGCYAALVAVPAPTSGRSTEGACRAPQARSITYIGVTRDQSRLRECRCRSVGLLVPAVCGCDTRDAATDGGNARDALPGWIAPFSNFPQDPDFEARTFSQDGPARSAGGETGWADFTLPDGEVGRSGAIVDPATAGNSNNTINRIVLRGNVPATFYLHVVTDNTDGEYDPTDLIRARGNIGSVDSDKTPGGGGLRARGRRPHLQRLPRPVHVPLRRLRGRRLPQASLEGCSGTGRWGQLRRVALRRDLRR